MVCTRFMTSVLAVPCECFSPSTTKVTSSEVVPVVAKIHLTSTLLGMPKLSDPVDPNEEPLMYRLGQLLELASGVRHHSRR